MRAPSQHEQDIVEVATRWEQALTKVFMDKDVIANETMHATMKRKR